MSALRTYSSFIYGHTVDTNNRYINFKEGGPELTATLEIGSYTLTKFLDVIAVAMNAAGANDYTVTLDRTTRIITLASSANFDLLVATGTNAGESVLPLMGISGADVLATTSVVGTLPSGSYYEPQFVLQEYLPSSKNKRAASATVSKSASGKISVQKFGDERFMKCNIKYCTDIIQPVGGPIQTQESGVDNVVAFMEYAITKAPLEFIQDKASPETFERVILESTSQAQDGTGYELRELYDRGLPYYFETGPLKFRVIEE